MITNTAAALATPDQLEAAELSALAAAVDRRRAAARLADAEAAAAAAVSRTRAEARRHRRAERTLLLSTAAMACIGLAVLLLRSAPWCTVALAAIAAVLLARVPQGGAEQ